MLYAEFCRTFAATLDNTEGFDGDQLDAINASVFDRVRGLDVADSPTKSVVDYEFERAFDKAAR